RVTLVDNGMPSVLIAASDLGVRGDESPAELEADDELNARIQELRLAAGELMGLGDVRDATVPKMVLLSPPTDGGTISTRSFIPIRVHTSIGVLGALTVAAGIREAGAVGADLAQLPEGDAPMRIEHPTGYFDVTPTAVLRTARKLLDGVVFPRPY